MDLPQELQAGLSHHRAARLVEAEQIYRGILARNPDYIDALHLLGVLLAESGKPHEGARLMQRAVERAPGFAELRNNLGNAFRAMGQFGDAIDCYRQAIDLNPNYVQAYFNLAITCQASGNFDEAVAAFHRAIRLKPDYLAALINLANVLQAKGKFDEAIAALEKAIQFHPKVPILYLNLAVALQGAGRFDEAINACRKAIGLQPNFAEAYDNLGGIFFEMGKTDEAVEAFRRAIALKPDFAEAHSNLGNMLKNNGQLEQAIASFRQAIQLKPALAAAHSNLVYTMNFSPNCDSAMIQKELEIWNQQHAQSLMPRGGTRDPQRDPEKRLRIGYVSPDFCDHVVGRNILPLFREHNHNEFEIFSYANVRRHDSFTESFKSYSNHWRDISGVSDSAASERIRSDKIDILVDLALHMARGRLLIFARKPALIQMTFAGYPGCTGVKTIDYRITDPFLDPPDTSETGLREKPIRLPHSFWCYDEAAMTMGMATIPQVNGLPAKDSGRITFGCLNNFAKVNQQVLDLWKRVLDAVPGSRMRLLAPPGECRRWVCATLGERVDFVEHIDRHGYLQYYHRIDIGLDTLPYNGHTTTLDSLWMGVPVITLVGQTVVGRAGLSQLTNLGLPELIANTPDQYLQIAAKLSGDLPRLVELRRTLRDRMQTSPLLDARGFALGIEEAFRHAWRLYCSQPI
jgi:protein O-GlcNAc transferase